MLALHAELARKLEALEKKYDAQLKVIFDAIRELMTPPTEKPQGRIGFRRPGEEVFDWRLATSSNSAGGPVVGQRLRSRPGSERSGVAFFRGSTESPGWRL
jgi:hypothetical protein